MGPRAVRAGVAMVVATSPTPPSSVSLAAQGVAVARRIPFTLAVVAVMLAAGIATGALWSSLHATGLMDRLAYGLPALEAHRWWTPVTGSFLAEVPLQYLPVAGGFLVLVGFAELRLGTRRTAVVTVVLQLAGVLGASLLLAADEGARVALGRPDLARPGRRVLRRRARRGGRRDRDAAGSLAGAAARGAPGLRSGVLRLHRRALGSRAPARHRPGAGARSAPGRPAHRPESAGR